MTVAGPTLQTFGFTAANGRFEPSLPEAVPRTGVFFCCTCYKFFGRNSKIIRVGVPITICSRIKRSKYKIPLSLIHL